MKVLFTPEGGRFGYGFDYYCLECGRFLGNTTDGKLNHPLGQSKVGWFRKRVTSIHCSHAGETYDIPKHEIEVTLSKPME